MSDIIFQILDWNWFHDEEEESKKYKIRLFGRTLENKTVYVQVDNFTPYFYIELPKNWRNHMTQVLMEEVKKRVWPKEHAGGLRAYNLVDDRHRLYGFTNYSKFTFLQLVFNDYDAMRAYERVFKKKIMIRAISHKAFKFKLYESNIEPLIRCMHTRDLDSVGFVKIDKDKYKTFANNPSCCEINISTDYTNLNRYDSETILPFVIASFDIECTSGDGAFPQAMRDDDKIIQIGTTFSRFGETECFFQHIITLGTCLPIEGATVESYQTEHEVLLAWTRMMREQDPDIVTGYNIFGFDLQYLKDRSKKLGIYHKFSKLSRINDEVCEWKEKKLASSALGENLLKYYEMTGRVLIDMMKVVQKDFKLGSYKLDFVAGSFIKESIEKIEYGTLSDKEISIIKAKGVYGVKVGQYVTVMYNDGVTENKHMDGKKFRILEIDADNKVLKVEGLIDMDVLNYKYKVYWCQAKDDVSPQEIFAKQKGTAKDRSIVARYCLMDCILVNKLIAKIQVVASNVSMAKVCHVPLSYLFMRGQGVKIFSLVARKCRLKKHLIPVVRKVPDKIIDDKNKTGPSSGATQPATEVKLTDEEIWEKFIDKLNTKEIGKDDDDDDNNDDDDEGYEGATVFPPKKGVHFEPIPVLDFASLYPNAMIFRNTSHEMYVDDPKFDNLPGYIFHEITYMTTKIVEKLPHAISKARKRELMQKYNEMGCSYQEVTKTIDDLVYSITYVYNTTKHMICELAISKKDFRLFKYETSRFAEKADGTKGIIPGILMDLLSARKKYKKMMEEEKDSFKKSILDCMQLAYKVTANSLYGQTGAPTSPIYLKNIAASTTATGREMLQYSKHFVEVDYAELILLALEKDKVVFLEKANEVYKYHPHKIQTKDHGIVHVNTVPFVEIAEGKFTKAGFKDKNDFFNKFYETMNKTLEGYTVKPEIIYGDSVTPDTPILLRVLKDGKYITEIKTIDTIDDSWIQYEQFKIGEIGLTDKQQSNNKLNYEVWTDKGWSKIKRVIRHKTNKKIYEVITQKGYVKVTEDHSLLTKDGFEIKPNECAIGTELLHSFPDINDDIDNEAASSLLVLGHPDGCKIKGELEAMKYYYKMKRYHKNIQINKINQNTFQITGSGETPSLSDKLIAINEIPNTYNYVYDLETSVGHFHAGIGELIVHNTDSVFFNPHIINDETDEVMKDKRALIMAIALGVWASICINIMLPQNMSQEYEKTMWPFAILTKKRYVGNLYEQDPDKYYQKSMGIVLKRRDNAPIVKIVCGGIIDQILNKRSAIGAVDFAKATIKQIFSGHYPIDKFIITKTLRETYADRTRIVHAVLADRMAARDPGNKPMSNDRIPYAYVEVKEEVELQGDRVEHPDYIISNKLKLDYLFYITNQIMKPSIQFLELIVENPTQIFDDFITRECNRRKGLKPLNYYFNMPDDENNDKNENKGLVINMDDDLKISSDEESDNEENSEQSLNAMEKNRIEKIITKKTISKPKLKHKRVDVIKPDEPHLDKINNGFILDEDFTTYQDIKQNIKAIKKPKAKKKVEITNLEEPKVDKISNGFYLDV